ncbi:stage 0 sporulation protein [bacterium]|jgi:cell fate regulator YaaT (PSP1 superfamily)|nr:stage 0 sporulation protein [bacterium]MBT4122104.1 stage 0 sporulation protein [bacterium]MBT4335382.1 stage 0 sporulation protein [bacterium]MBT4495501.1 stage 0 sporulation protein [bacterium]MBT4764313.1 stage 0 sporulation protein [bacterium]
MQIISVQFTPWDKEYYFLPEDNKGRTIELKKGDQVVVETILGKDIGTITSVGELSKDKELNDEIKPIMRKARSQDKLKILEINKDNDKVLKYCHEQVKKFKLPMKLVDVHKSFDETRVTFAFIADGRVDFRDLLKELIRKYKKSIRLQQLGVRDEAKINGDLGSCGRSLCCSTHLKELGNVTTEMAKDQQVAHRGSERLSGRCGRLKCCLRYEEPVYKELAEGFPEIGSKIKTKQGHGIVKSWHTLKGTVDVIIEDRDGRQIVEVAVR